MGKLIMAEENSRDIYKEDKIFGINKKARDMVSVVGRDKVINATIGTFMDNRGNLVVLPTVLELIKNLSPADYAEYAPVAGTPDYLEAVKKAVFMDYVPKGFISAVATPGGTGAIRNAVQNYTRRGDAVLTSDWHWSPYEIIVRELERSLNTFTLFDDNMRFNISSFREKVDHLIEKQDSLVIIINTPSHNPTGYSVTLNDWDQLLFILKKSAADSNKRLILLIDAAYLDFAGSIRGSRNFLSKLDGLPNNILILIAFSISKSFTLYGMRGGALICLTAKQDIAREFKTVIALSARGTWSNSPRAAMVLLSRIYKDKSLLAKVMKEKEEIAATMVSRGKAFMEAADASGLSICPYNAGFFSVVLCDNSDAIGEELQKDGIFTIPFNGKGLRISIASITEADCVRISNRIAVAINKVNR